MGRGWGLLRGQGMRNKLFIAGFNGCRQLLTTFFFFVAVIGASQATAQG